jgi:hypothetical protein
MLRPACLLMVAATVGIATASSFGQWTSDPAANTLVATGNNDQVQPKIRSTADGGCYISFFDNQSGGYDVRLQRLDAAGVVQWPGGVLIADRSFSSTQDYGACTDTEGFSLLAFRDDRSGSQNVTAQRVSPSGQLMWGTGVSMPGSAGGSVPRITGTSDGGSVVAWTTGSSVALVKLTSEGSVVWTRTVTGPGGVNVIGAYLVASDAPGQTGAFVLSMVRFGSFSTPRNLYAQKFDIDGNPLWGASPLTIYGTGSLQIGNYPPFVSDGAGGAVLTWYGTTGGLQCYVQRVYSDGSLQFVANGERVVSTTGQQRVGPAACIDQSTGDIYCFWTELNSSQSNHGLGGQRFVGTSRAWGESGLVLVPLGASEVQQVRVQPRNGGATVLWAQGNLGNQTLVASARDSSGADAWSGFVTFSSIVTGKSRLDTTVLGEGTMSGPGTIYAVWQDGRDSASAEEELYAQNIRIDGTLGTADIPGDLNHDGEVNGADLAILLSGWGPCRPKGKCIADLNGDGVVNGADLSILLGNWG